MEMKEASLAGEKGRSYARGTRYAIMFESAMEEFVHLIEDLTDEQWVHGGQNYPERLNDEDEHRTVGVIAHHVAISADGIMGRIQALVDGRPLPSVGSGTPGQTLQAVSSENARHATDYASVTKDEVLQLLRGQQKQIAAALRAIPDDRIDQSSDTPAGPMSVAQRIERVLIGHLRMHQGSIEAAIF